MYNQEHLPPPQHLICYQHNEPIKGVCLFTGKCTDRFLCRTCRRLHDSNHLNAYEEWDYLRSQALIRDLNSEFDAINQKIDQRNATHEENIRFIRSQIEYLFKEIHNYVLNKLTQTRENLINTVNKKLEKNNVIKHGLRMALADVNKTFEKAYNTNFSHLPVAEEMVRAVCNAQNLRDSTDKDSELQSKETISFSLNHHANATSGTLFEQIKISLEQVCHDIANSFVVDTSGKLPSVPKDAMIGGGLRDLGDQSSVTGINHQPMFPPGRPNEPFGSRTSPFGKPAQTTTPQRIATILGQVNREEEEARKRGEVLEYLDRAVTSHKCIMSGGLAYVPDRDRKHLVTAGTEGVIEVLDVGSANMRSCHTLKVHEGEIMKMLYIKEKKILLSAGTDDKICVIDCHKKYSQLHSFTKHNGPVYAMEYLPDQDLVVSGGDDEILRMWNVNTCKEIYFMRTPNARIGSITRLEGTNRIAVGFHSGQINIFSLGQMRKMMYSFKGHNSFVVNLMTIPEQKLLLSGADDGVKIWKLHETKADHLRRFAQQPGMMLRSFTIFPEKDLLITNNDQSQLQVWKLSSGQKLGDRKDKTCGECLVALPDLEEIATANGNEVKRWIVNL